MSCSPCSGAEPGGREDEDAGPDGTFASLPSGRFPTCGSGTPESPEMSGKRCSLPVSLEITSFKGPPPDSAPGTGPCTLPRVGLLDLLLALACAEGAGAPSERTGSGSSARGLGPTSLLSRSRSAISSGEVLRPRRVPRVSSSERNDASGGKLGSSALPSGSFLRARQRAGDATSVTTDVNDSSVFGGPATFVNCPVIRAKSRTACRLLLNSKGSSLIPRANTDILLSGSRS